MVCERSTPRPSREVARNETPCFRNALTIGQYLPFERQTPMTAMCLWEVAKVGFGLFAYPQQCGLAATRVLPGHQAQPAVRS
jgi:hypothetical protein